MPATTKAAVRYNCSGYLARISRDRASSTMSAEAAVKRAAEKYLARFDGLTLVAVRELSWDQATMRGEWEVEFKLEEE